TARELERSCEQPGGSALVAVPRGPSARSGQTLGGPQRESRVWPTELRVIARCLLEVVPDDLVELDQVVAAILEPVCEPGVQVGAHRLGERVVGGITDQQVPEAEAVVAGEHCPVGADQLLARQ